MKREVPWNDDRQPPGPERVEGPLRSAWLRPVVKDWRTDEMLRDKAYVQLSKFMLTARYKAMRSAYFKGIYSLERFTELVWEEAFSNGH